MHVFPHVSKIQTLKYNLANRMVQRRAARYTMTNSHNTSSVNTIIDTLGWPTLAERRLKTRLIMFCKITHCKHDFAQMTNLLCYNIFYAWPQKNALSRYFNKKWRGLLTSVQNHACITICMIIVTRSTTTYQRI
jgi:hypothetical protein